LGDYKLLIKRISSSIILIIVIGWIVLSAPLFLYLLAGILISILSLNELYKLFNKKGYIAYKGIGFIFTFIFFFYFYFKIGIYYFIYLIPLILFLLFLFQFTRKNSQNGIISLSLTLFGLIYISLPMSFFVEIRTLEYGKWLVAYLIFTIKASDIGAYLVGTIYGKHLLIPRISPKKSIEGFIGGIIFSWIAAYIGALWLPVISLRHVPAIGLISGVLSQLGDLSESLIKRDCGVKDSDKTIPGIGGILDIIDSLLFALPIYYFYLVYIGIK
jgi:phosphatidate cytidylyltransferase